MTASSKFCNPPPDSSEITPAHLEKLLELQTSILGKVVTSDDPGKLLEQLCLLAEKLATNAVASIMLYDESLQKLHVHTAPNAPEEVIQALNGLEIGEGSCGNAIYHDSEMYVCNTLTDARWEKQRDVAIDFNINACWSIPIHDEHNQAIGTFALSSFTTRSPSNFQRRLLISCSAIAGIIFQHAELQQHQHNVQQQLADINETISVTVQSLGDGIISTDSHGDIVLFNPVAEQLTGWSYQEAIGQNIDQVFNILNSETDELVCNPITCIINDKQCYRDDENLSLISRDGSVRYISLSEAPIIRQDDTIEGVVLTFRDITKQHQDQKALAASQKRYQSFINNSADALLLHNAEGRFIEVNQMACDSLGYTREELLSLSVSDIEVSTPRFDMFSDFIDSLPFDKSSTVEGVHQRKDGSQFPIEARLRKFLSDGEVFILASSRDITDKKNADREMIKAKKLESIGLLAGGIAHDFNNMLSGILGNIDLALLKLDKTHRATQHLDKAKKASLRAADLTQQLLTFSKGGEPIKQSENIFHVVKESVEFSMHGSNSIVNYYQPEDLWLTSIDSGQIGQVIQNLVINARQAMPDGGQLDIHLENRIIDSDDQVSRIALGNYVKIDVSDTGSGIPQDIIHSIFDPYFSTKQEGSGLGLALSYSIIKKHNGYLTVSSEIGKGTTFSLYLPATDEDIDTGTQDYQGAYPCSCGANILILDDDEMIRDTCESMLDNMGYNVFHAQDGETAISLYEQAKASCNPIDLIIMDLTIPDGMGGKEALQHILTIDPDARAIVSSGYSNDPVMANFQDFGFLAAVAKPYTQDDLCSSVCRILNQDKPERLKV